MGPIESSGIWKLVKSGWANACTLTSSLKGLGCNRVVRARLCKTLGFTARFLGQLTERLLQQENLRPMLQSNQLVAVVSDHPVALATVYHDSHNVVFDERIGSFLTYIVVVFFFKRKLIDNCLQYSCILPQEYALYCIDA